MAWRRFPPVFVDKKPFIYIWRPFYRLVIAGMVRPLVARFAAIATSGILPPLAAREAEYRERWAALEQFMLAVLADRNRNGEAVREQLTVLSGAVDRLVTEIEEIGKRLDRIERQAGASSAPSAPEGGRNARAAAGE